VTILPHLPAPTALQDPLSGYGLRAARTVAQRADVHRRAAIADGGRVHPDAARADWEDIVDRQAQRRRGGLHEAYRDPRPSPRIAGDLFFIQRFAQEESPSARPSVAHETAAAAYPSLSFDTEILLPGEAIPLDWIERPRLDILV